MHDRRKGGHARLRKQPTRCQIPGRSSALPIAASGVLSITAFGSSLATGSRDPRKALDQPAVWAGRGSRGLVCPDNESATPQKLSVKVADRQR